MSELQKLSAQIREMNQAMNKEIAEDQKKFHEFMETKKKQCNSNTAKLSPTYFQKSL